MQKGRSAVKYPEEAHFFFLSKPIRITICYTFILSIFNYCPLALHFAMEKLKGTRKYPRTCFITCLWRCGLNLCRLTSKSKYPIFTYKET